MTDECDELQEDEWPNDSEANDIILAYASTDESAYSESGCAGTVLAITLVTFTLFWILVR